MGAATAAADEATTMAKSSSLARPSGEVRGRVDSSLEKAIAAADEVVGIVNVPPQAHAKDKVEVVVASNVNSHGAVRWVEVVSESLERYYHEVATGRTQWELPSEGWVELVHTDGSLYYWEPKLDTTQWNRP